MNETGSLNTLSVSIGKTKRPRLLGAFGTNETRGLGGRRLRTHPDGHGGRRRLFRMDGALAAEDAPLVDDERADHDIAEHLAGSEDLEAPRGVHLVLDVSNDDHVVTDDVGFDLARVHERQATSGRQ